MSSLKKALTKVQSRFSRQDGGLESTSRQPKDDGDVPHENGNINLEPSGATSSQDHETSDDEKRDELEASRREAYQRDDLKENYGDVPDGAAQDLETIDVISEKQEGDLVKFRARIHHRRPISPKIVFLVFRHRLSTIQGLVMEEEGFVSENMVQWSKRLHRETIVLVEGTVQKPKEGQEEVRTTTIHKFEVKVRKVFVVAVPTVTMPFQVIDAGRSVEAFEKDNSHFTSVNERTRLDHRVLDLRTPTSQAIFSIHSGVCKLFRSYLDEQRFIEISSSKLNGSATESGASVFKVDYFKRAAFLAQSPQLAKQMCIAADMERVYEIGPVFRAENSNTHRHLTEFTGLDIEMSFDYNYYEVIDMLDSVLLHIFRGLQSQYRKEIEVVKKQFPHDDLVFPEKTLRLKFQEGVKILRDSGWKEDDGSEPSDFDDLSTKGEQRLGQLIKEKYNTDYYILDKFPLAARPFYTMPDSEDDRLSNSCDFFLRGEEILSGGQRIHHAQQLEHSMQDAGIDPDSMKEYVDGFRWGCPPHGGGGIGLERLIMLFLGLHNVRWASLFPRDPKSFPQSGREALEASAAAAQSTVVHGPKAVTFRAKNPKKLPPLPDLIAKYGDSTNTAWVDPAWTVWRDAETGAAVAYMPKNGYAITFGNPLCEPGQVPTVIRAYLAHLREERHLKPLWCCVDKGTEKYLAQNLGWSALVAVGEERLNPTEVSLDNDKNVRRKLHRAEREGVKCHEITGEPDEEFRSQVEQRLQDWRSNRKGRQAHLTGLRPFDDMAHRRYYYATDKKGKICCLVVLAQLAATKGLQIKWSLEFPAAPPGAIEYILAYVIKKVGKAGISTATFGAAATHNLQKVENVGGIRVMLLEKAYNAISSTFSLTNKSDFRQKFGVQQDPLYVCYPKGTAGVRGINAIMGVLQKPK